MPRQRSCNKNMTLFIATSYFHTNSDKEKYLKQAITLIIFLQTKSTNKTTPADTCTLVRQQKIGAVKISPVLSFFWSSIKTELGLNNT